MKVPDYLHDSVKVIVDDTGNAVSRMEYLPYGETWFQEGDQNHAPKYNSQELDKESGFYYYNARHYDPEIGRFVTADDVVDGLLNTQGWNRYSYVLGNPIIYKDPTGHAGELSEFGELGAAAESLWKITKRAAKRIVVEASRASLGDNVPQKILEEKVPFKKAETFEEKAGDVTAYVLEPVVAYLGAKKGLGARRRFQLRKTKLKESALQKFISSKGIETRLTKAGRALTKHPELIGKTKAELFKSLKTTEQINKTSHKMLENVLQKGKRIEYKHKRYGEIVQYKIEGGVGARFYAGGEKAGEFIGFIGSKKD